MSNPCTVWSLYYYLVDLDICSGLLLGWKIHDLKNHDLYCIMISITYFLICHSVHNAIYLNNMAKEENSPITVPLKYIPLRIKFFTVKNSLPPPPQKKLYFSRLVIATCLVLS